MKLFDLKKSLEFTEDTLEKKVNDLKSENEKFKTKMKELYEYQVDSPINQINRLDHQIDCVNKLFELEYRSRKYNLRIDGVNKTSNEA